MKKILLAVAGIFLLLGFAIRAYFALTPPPESTLLRPLADIVPKKLATWKVWDKNMADSMESSLRVSKFLNFDDALFRVFEKGDTFVGLYIAYWSPGKASYRWAGAHTPDTCWVLNGWTREHREYSIPLSFQDANFKPAEYGVYAREGNAQNVYFWHLVGGEPHGYSQKGGHNIMAALLDIREFGFNLRQEQFFVRLSSNRTLQELEKFPEIAEVIHSLKEIRLLEGEEKKDSLSLSSK